MSIISTNAVELTQSSQAATESADGRRQTSRPHDGNPLARLGSLSFESTNDSSSERAQLCRNAPHSENETVNHDESRTQKVSASRPQAQFIAWESRAAHAH